jgi:hypothetical protein
VKPTVQAGSSQSVKPLQSSSIPFVQSSAPIDTQPPDEEDAATLLAAVLDALDALEVVPFEELLFAAVLFEEALAPPVAVLLDAVDELLFPPAPPDPADAEFPLPFDVCAPTDVLVAAPPAPIALSKPLPPHAVRRRSKETRVPLEAIGMAERQSTGCATRIRGQMTVNRSAISSGS